MTTTQYGKCALCGERTICDFLNGERYCREISTCLNRAHAYLEETDYRDATPEMYDLFKAREAQVKSNWENSVNYSQKLFTVLGLDDITFLTHLEEMRKIEAE